MIGQIDDYKKKLQKQGLSKEQIRNRKDIQEMNRVLEKKITYVEQTVPLLNEQDEQKKKSKKSVKDPTDVTTYTINQLKDFMRERRIKGLTGKKAELLARVQAYLANDDEL
jgi:Na+/phosphate symporter